MRALFIFFFMLCVGSMFPGCRSVGKLDSTARTETVVREKLVPVPVPADSAAIRALLECDSTGRVVLRWLDMANSRNTELQFKLDSMGNVLAGFRLSPDTVFVPVRDSTHIDIQTEVVEVERKLTRWQRFCMAYTVITLVLAILFAGLKARGFILKFIRQWR